VAPLPGLRIRTRDPSVAPWECASTSPPACSSSRPSARAGRPGAPMTSSMHRAATQSTPRTRTPPTTPAPSSTRCSAAASGSSVPDGKDRVEIARLHVDDAPPFLVSADVHKATGPIVVDGKLDEADWAKALTLGPFAAWDGKTAIERKTTAKLVWDADNLYVA